MKNIYRNTIINLMTYIFYIDSICIFLCIRIFLIFFFFKKKKNDKMI